MGVEAKQIVAVLLEGSAKDISGMLAGRHPDIEFNLEDGSEGRLVLARLVARRDAPPGSGTAFMKDLVNIADELGKTVTLQTATRDSVIGTPKFKKTTSTGRLKKFYRRFGFKSNYGKWTYRPNFQGNMHREPKPYERQTDRQEAP
jgi:hypothetical protein